MASKIPRRPTRAPVVGRDETGTTARAAAWVRAVLIVVSAGVVAACGGGDGASGRADIGRTAAGASADPVILFLGTSLTAGQGVALEDAYPALVQRKIDSAGYRGRVVNAGVSGETSAAGLRRLDWLLRQHVDILVLELGANDGLRGQDVDSMRANLQAIIDRTRETYPDVEIVIAGMEAPPNLGDRYTSRFRRTFVELAESNDASLIPFLLVDVAGERALNQADGIHPTEEGHRIMAETVWRVLEGLLRR